MSNPLNKISYGLYVLTAKEGDKDNGCVVNTVQQVTSEPQRISVAVNKSNYTHHMIVRTGVFNVNCLTVETPFKVFENFGFQSGRDVDKFADCPCNDNFSANGLRYLPKYANAYISGKVVQTVDLGTHSLFIADVTEAVDLNDVQSLTYDYYHKNIKLQPNVTPKEKTQWVCTVCGYVYEGEELPADFVCPWCNHGREDFEKVQ